MSLVYLTDQNQHTITAEALQDNKKAEMWNTLVAAFQQIRYRHLWAH